MFPEGAARRALSHRRRDAVVLPRDRALRRARPATRETLRKLLPMLVDIVAASSAGHALRHRRRSGRRPAARKGQQGYQLTWMDAKVDDWVVTPRRGKAVEINALWYNALCLLEAWIASSTAAASGRTSPATPRARATSFNERFWYDEGRLPLRRRRRRAAATTRPAGRIRSSRSRSPHPVLDARALGAGDGGGARAAADAGRPALAGAGPSRTTRRATTATCAPATPPTTRAPSGPG